MSNNLTDIELKVLSVLQRGMPATTTPYRDMAERIGIETQELLEVIEKWQKDGILRRVGAIVNHFKVGITSGAMVTWRVESDRLQEVGRMLAEFEQVSHAYERVTTANWSYNLYTMVHGHSDEQVLETVKQMAATVKVDDYMLLTTERELKKAPPTYVTDAQ